MVWIQVGMATGGRKNILKTGMWTGRNKNWNKEFDPWGKFLATVPLVWLWWIVTSFRCSLRERSIFCLFLLGTRTFIRFWIVCMASPVNQAMCSSFIEFPHVSVITQLDYSRNGRFCVLRLMCLRYADDCCHN